MNRRAVLARRGLDLISGEGGNLAHSARLLIVMAISRGALFVAFALLLRRMGSFEFGVFFLGYNTLAFVSQFADFGIGQTFVRHIAFHNGPRPEFAAYLYWLFFLLKLASAGVVAVAALVASPLAARFLHLEDQRRMLEIAIAGASAVILFDFVNCVFQSSHLFGRYELNLFLKNALFLIAVIVAIFWRPHWLTAVALVACLVAINSALAALAYPFLQRRWQARAGGFGDFRPDLFRYSGWLTIATVCFALYRRMDVYYLSHFRSRAEVGTYSVALVLVEPIAMISPALFTVFLPKLSADLTKERVARFVGLVARLCVLVLVGCGLYAVAVRLAFPLLGAEYGAALPLTMLLLVGTVFLIGYNLLSVVFLASDRPEVFGGIALAMALFSALANWFIVPMYGAYGAAAVYGLSQLGGIALATVFIAKWLRRGIFLSTAAGEVAVPG